MRTTIDLPEDLHKQALAIAATGHEFSSDSVSFADVDLGGMVGHRQVTDAYLAQLARSRKGQLATLDGGLAHLHGDVALLVPTTP